MMEARKHPGADWLPLAVLLLTAIRALPGLFAAWQDDVYSRGALLAFALWILPAASRAWRQMGSDGSGFWWMLLALASGVAGAMTTLRIFDHLSLAFAMAGLVWRRAATFVWLACLVSWLPAAGYFASRFLTGGLAGWERPGISALGVLAYFTVGSRNHIPSKP